MRIPLPKPVDLAAEPLLGSIALLEVNLVLTADALRPGADPPWAGGSLEQDDDGIATRVLAHECLHLQRLLADHRRRLHRKLRRLRDQLDLPF